MQTERLPNFILIGAQKSGTTSLYHALRKHPEIFLSTWKEPKYFMVEHDGTYAAGPPPARMVTDWSSYLNLFSESGHAQAVGEASVMYLSSYFPERTARQIRERLPNAKLIAILRHPVDRAYSAYTFFRSRGFESVSNFKDALSLEEERIKANTQPDLFYLRNGLYGEHLEKFLRFFPRDQIKVFLYEDWSQRPQEVLKEIFSFLAVDSNITICPLKRAVTTVPRNRIVAQILKTFNRRLAPHLPRMIRKAARLLVKINSKPPPPLDLRTRNQLIDYFEQDIRKLQSLIGRDLSHWLMRRQQNG
jgi:hypothetical protein